MTRRPAVATLLLAAAPIAGFADRSAGETLVCPAARFLQAPHFAAGTAPADVTLADLDGDGALDAVMANAGLSPGISILMGDGAGSFLPPIHFSVAQQVNRVAVARLDPGAHLDIVAAGQSGVNVYRGNGEGTFQDPVSYGAGAANTLSILDLNGDGKLDLGVGGEFEIDVFPGTGDGTFASPIVQVNADYVTAVAFGRFDADDVPDMLVGPAISGQYTFFYKGNGDGTFAVPIYNFVGEAAQSIAAGDVNGDGRADAVVVTEHGLAVLLSHGDGTFDPVIPSPLPVPGGPGLVLGDFHGDGGVVAAFTSGNQSQHAIFMASLGDGTFAVDHVYQTGFGSHALAAGDVDGDGLLDAVTANDLVNQIAVLTNAGGGRFRAIETIALSSGPALFAAGDFDGDGSADLAALGNFAVVTLLGDGQGSFAAFAWLDLLFGPNGIESGDFDGDGKLDLVLTTDYGLVALLRGHGDGTIGDPEPTATSFQIRRPLTADVNGDLKLDVVLVSGNPPALAVLLGNGDGTFQLPVAASVPEAPTDAVLRDFNGDGVLDAALPIDHSLDFNGSVAVLRGHGDGTFDPAVTIPGGADPAGIAAADFDGDGHPDLVLANAAAENIALFQGSGEGFDPPALIAQGVTASGILAEDLDGDGNADVATVSTAGRVSVLIGLGNGRFQAPVPYSTGWTPSFLRSVVTGPSGRADLIAASSNGSQIFVLRNGQLEAAVPAATSIIAGQAAVLHASASGYGPVGYQWRKDGAPLSDGGAISGSTTATLTIDPVSFADAGSYDVLVTDSCSSTASNTAALSVEFADVPASSPFHDDIIAIATDGVTGGCGGGNYCPAAAVRRDQMAVFLLKSEHGSDYVPPACSGVFADVPCVSPFAPWIEQLAAEGVTGGCGGGNYCPDQSVTRAQMAIFLLKTSLGSSYSPPTPVGLFGDVPVGSFGAGFIEDLYTRGITGGCQTSPLLYCPANAVLRQQMATFLVRTFHP